MLSHKQTKIHETITILLEILDNKTEDRTRMTNVIDVALYILKVNPSHWSTFAKILGFDRDTYDSQWKEMMFNLFFSENFSTDSDVHQFVIEWNDDDFKQMAKDTCSAACNNTTYFCQKSIIRPTENPWACFNTHTTNVSEKFAS